ncbi:hypothetical protein [Actinoallomurus sp. CA-150999]
MDARAEMSFVTVEIAPVGNCDPHAMQGRLGVAAPYLPNTSAHP